MGGHFSDPKSSFKRPRLTSLRHAFGTSVRRRTFADDGKNYYRLARLPPRPKVSREMLANMLQRCIQQYHVGMI
jgi:hypothetical protein